MTGSRTPALGTTRVLARFAAAPLSTAAVDQLLGEQHPMLPLKAAVCPEVDEVLDRAEVVVQAGDVGAQAGEDEAPVGPHPGSADGRRPRSTRRCWRRSRRGTDTGS